MPSSPSSSHGVAWWRPAAAALVSRWAFLAVGALSDAAWPDYDTSKAFASRGCEPNRPARAMSPVARALTSPLAWDLAYFDRIAQCGYEYEQYYAFFPGVPWLMSGFGRLRSPSIRALLGLLVSQLAFAAAAAVLFRLGLRVTRCRRRAAASVAVLCISPSTVFLTYPYSESAFLLLTFLGELFRIETGSVLLAAVPWTLGCFLRSNGIVNAGFLLWHSAQVCAWSLRRKLPARLAVITALQCLLGIACLFTAVNIVMARGVATFCESSAWKGESPARPWCPPATRSLYSHVQQEYWGVGLFRYYRIKQVPNFLLAAPVATIAASAIWSYARRNPRAVLTIGHLLPADSVPQAVRGELGRKAMPSTPFTVDEMFVYIAHLAGMLTIGVSIVHIQVLTRFLSSCPALYWYMADVIVSGGRREHVLLLMFCLCWTWSGLILFPNFYPWT